jgi:hypothetical protein
MLKAILKRVISPSGEGATGPNALARETARQRTGDEPDAAVARLERAIAAEPTAFKLHAELGLLRQRSGDFPAAAKVYRRAAEAAEGGQIPSEQRAAEFRVLELVAHLRAGDFDAAAAAVEAALRHGPSRDLARKLAHHIEAMKFVWPAERSRLPPAADEPDIEPAAAGAPNVVYFHVEPKHRPHPSCDDVDYFDLIAASSEASRRALRDCRTILLTDESTAIPAGLPIDQTVRLPLSPEEVVRARLKAMVAFLASPLAETDSVFLDSDAVVVGDLAGVFGRRFDVAFTTRSNWAHSPDDLMPFNVGVMFARGRGREAAHGFFAMCVECLDRLEQTAAVQRAFPEGIRRWWGDQIAPAAVVGWRAYQSWILPGHTDRLRVGPADVLFLPSDQYNFSIDGEASPEILRSKRILHFKGRRKAAIRSCLAALVSRDSGSDRSDARRAGGAA